MAPARVLVVDDEKNIRLTLVAALGGLGLDVDTAADGREALDRLAEGDVWLVLLDLRMPGLDGIGVLRRLRELQPEAHVVVVTAHGTVGNAVEAMKLGAVDVLSKPFTPDQIRGLVDRLRRRDALDPEPADDYDSVVELARRAIARRQLDDARDFVRRALDLDAARPDAHNLLGVLHEVSGERLEAQNRYRRALALDPTFAPARANLAASVEPRRATSYLLGEAKAGKEKAGEAETGEPGADSAD